MMDPSAVGNPIVRHGIAGIFPLAARLAAAAIVLQSVDRGNVDRRLATGLAAYYVAVQSGFV